MNPEADTEGIIIKELEILPEPWKHFGALFSETLLGVSSW